MQCAAWLGTIARMSHGTSLSPVLVTDCCQKHLPGMHSKRAFACKADVKKRLLFVFVFNLRGERAMSSKTTAGAVKVRQAPAVILSCATISQLSPYSKQSRAAGFKSSSQAASTNQGQLKYIKKHRPLIGVNENVESLN